ncbi:MAG: DUF4136 domain-containing protein [Nibricoccus sp.]
MPQLPCRKSPLCTFILVFALSSLFSGCAHLNQVQSTVVVKSAETSLLAEKGKSFSFVSANAGKRSENRPQYEAQIEKQLVDKGWHRLPDNSTDADYVLEFRHTQSVMEKTLTTARLTTTSTPVAPQQSAGRGAYTARNPATPRPAQTTIERDTFSMKVDHYTLTFKIKRTARNPDEASLEVWSISIYGNAHTKDEIRVIPAMIEAAFKNFPGTPGKTYAITGPVR